MRRWPLKMAPGGQVRSCGIFLNGFNKRFLGSQILILCLTLKIWPPLGHPRIHFSNSGAHRLSPKTHPVKGPRNRWEMGTGGCCGLPRYSKHVLKSVTTPSFAISSGLRRIPSAFLPFPWWPLESFYSSTSLKIPFEGLLRGDEH